MGDVEEDGGGHEINEPPDDCQQTGSPGHQFGAVDGHEETVVRQGDPQLPEHGLVQLEQVEQHRDGRLLLADLERRTTAPKPVTRARVRVAGFGRSGWLAVRPACLRGRPPATPRRVAGLADMSDA